MRRFGVPHRETPKAVVLATTEIPIVLMELCLATLFSFTLVAPLGLPWWTPLVGLCAVLAVVGGLARLARRHPLEECRIAAC